MNFVGRIRIPTEETGYRDNSAFNGTYRREKKKKKNLYSDPDAVQKASETQHWLTVMDTVQHTV